MKKKHRRATIELGWWEDDKGFETGLNEIRQLAMRTGALVVTREDDVSSYEVGR